MMDIKNSYSIKIKCLNCGSINSKLIDNFNIKKLINSGELRCSNCHNSLLKIIKPEVY